MQRRRMNDITRTREAMPPAVRHECLTLAEIADPEDSYRQLARRVADLSERQVQRRIEAMERDMGLQPAPASERGGGRRPRDGRPVQHAGPYRRAGSIARAWKRFRSEDCL